MEFQKSVIELIKMRKSSRTFDQTNIKSITLKSLEDYITKITTKREFNKMNSLLIVCPAWAQSNGWKSLAQVNSAKCIA